MDDRRLAVITPRLIVGLFVIVAGVLLAIDRLGLVDVGPVWRFWPVVLIALGIGRLTQPRRSWGGGLVLLLLGGWFLVRELWIIDLRFADLLPALVLLAGVTMVVTAVNHGRRRGEAGTDNPLVPSTSDTVEAFALLGGVNQATNSQQFRGGNATAILGSCQIDLRQAKMAGAEVVIDTFAWWGGVEILVPETWSVVVHGFSLLGTFEDATDQPVEGTSPRLIVRGMTLMGGVEIKNRERRGRG